MGHEQRRPPHKISTIVDGGDLLAQARLDLESNDTVGSINHKLFDLGTHLLVHVIEKLKCGERLTFHRQDLSVGFERTSRQWTRHHRRAITRIAREGLIPAMLRRPARKHRQEIVTLDTCGTRTTAPRATPRFEHRSD